jgi:hypothetical protein
VSDGMVTEMGMEERWLTLSRLCTGLSTFKKMWVSAEEYQEGE